MKKTGILNLHFEVDAAVYAAPDGTIETEEYRLRPLRTPHDRRARGEGLRHADVRRAVGAVHDRARLTIPVGELRFHRHGLLVPHPLEPPGLGGGAVPLGRLLRR